MTLADVEPELQAVLILRTKFQNFPGGNTPGPPNMGGWRFNASMSGGRAPNWHFSGYGPATT